MAASRHVLMCEPTHYRIAYEINPWMRTLNAVDGARALEQWRSLYGALTGLGVQVELIDQHPEVPDMTFTANAGVALGAQRGSEGSHTASPRFLPSNFRYPERAAEEPYFIEWFRDRGYAIEEVHRPHYWEGEGDLLPADGRAFGGHFFRTEERSYDHLDELLGVTIERLELTDDRFYHLDTCFCPLGERRALYYPPAFAESSRALLERSFDDLIAVPEAEALRFACNALVVDGGAVVMNTGCPETEAALAARELRAVSTPTDEFIKAGGSVKCLVLMLDAYGS
ncbi:MAG: arginine deiminase-related protein [Chloroflexi bacterium]|nr:arginine deiminase-related protein [Chloroflexota bacterium]